MYGNDYGYAATRVNNTIVRLKKDNSPVYVLGINAEGICHVVPIEEEWIVENATQIHLDDLNLAPVRLGYINTAGEATYAMRIPMRRDWKQGLRQENCTTSNRRLFAIPMKDLKNCIMGVYPKFSTAVADVQKGTARGRKKLIAWSRSWAIDSDSVIYYKDVEPVGKLENGEPILHVTYKYLAESLAESIK